MKAPVFRKPSDAKQLKELSVMLLCVAESMDPKHPDYSHDLVSHNREIYQQRAGSIAEIIVRQQKRRFAKIRRMIGHEEVRA